MRNLIDWLKRWWLPIGFTLAVTAFACMVAKPQVVNCWGDWTSWPSRADGLVFLQPSTPCLKLNEIGDFLAGVFAPLAFAWLAWAVILQSKELETQREEFKLARDIAKEAKNATREQAMQAKRSADLLEQQTEYLRREIKSLAEKEAGVLLNTLVSQIENPYPKCGVVVDMQLPEPDEFGKQCRRFHFTAFMRLDQLQELSRAFKSLGVKTVTFDEYTSDLAALFAGVDQAVDKMKQALDVSEDISQADEVNFKARGYEKRLALLKECADHLRQLPPNEFKSYADRTKN